MTFYLVRRDRRVVLTPETLKSDELLKEIEAESWLKARLTINEDNFAHDEGHGWIER